MSESYQFDRLRKLLYGKHGRQLRGCCGVRECIHIGVAEEDLEMLKEKFSYIIQTDKYKCEGYNKDDDSFDPSKCHCEPICGGCEEYIRNDSGEIIKNDRYGEYRLPFWGLLMNHFHTPTINIILACLKNVNYNDHHHIFHLIKLMYYYNHKSEIFDTIWDGFAQNNPTVLLNGVCCDKNCTNIYHDSKYLERNNTFLQKTIFMFSDKEYDYFGERLEKLIALSKSLNLPINFLEKSFIIDLVNYDDEDEWCIKIFNELLDKHIDLDNICMNNPIIEAINNYSLKSIKLLHTINPNWVHQMHFDHDYGHKPTISPIINYVLESNSHRCSESDQEKVANLIKTLLELGAEYGYSYYSNGTISTMNYLKDYCYDYPNSPVMNVFKQYDKLEDEYDPNCKILIEVSKTNSRKEDTVHSELDKYRLIKDPARFREIAEIGLQKYKNDWISAGNKYPYWFIGCLVPIVGPIKNLSRWISYSADPNDIDLDVLPDYVDNDTDHYFDDNYEDVDYTYYFGNNN